MRRRHHTFQFSLFTFHFIWRAPHYYLPLPTTTHHYLLNIARHRCYTRKKCRRWVVHILTKERRRYNARQKKCGWAVHIFNERMVADVASIKKSAWIGST